VTDRNMVSLAAGCAVLLAAGCGGAARDPAAAPVSAHPARTAGTLTAIQRRVLAARYLAIAQPANRMLDHDFDGQHDAEERGDLAAADADLRAAAATERAFDRRLIALTFSPSAQPFVRLLYQVNQARAALTATAATAMSLTQLHGVRPRLDAANGPVEEAVQVIRDQLDLPPPDTS
jgi:DNA-binding GntR family transcriptional regulator